MTGEFKTELFADVGTSEAFVARISLGLIEVLNATNFRYRQKINDAIMNILFEGLLPAFISLREIKEFETGSKKLIRANLNKSYYNLYDHLWDAYKDRMQVVANLLGFNMGFLFQNNKEFKKGCEIFLKKHTGIDNEFINMLENERDTWQKIVMKIRNDYLKHKKPDSKQLEKYFTFENAELTFNNSWQAIEDILVVLMRTGLQLDAGIDIAEIPEEKRDPNCPKRFRFCATNNFKIGD